LSPLEISEKSWIKVSLCVGSARYESRQVVIGDKTGMPGLEFMLDMERVSTHDISCVPYLSMLSHVCKETIEYRVWRELDTQILIVGDDHKLRLGTRDGYVDQPGGFTCEFLPCEKRWWAVVRHWPFDNIKDDNVYLEPLELVHS